MKKSILLFAVLIVMQGIFAQDTDQVRYLNTASRMLEEEERLTIGGYAQVDYNQPINSGIIENGKLDVHRLVMMFGYKFNQKVKFISEIEFEHVKEVSVEQTFIQYEIAPWLNLRAGLLLIPMGIINKYHEPPSFNGVERPNVDKYIVPTTWREIGIGFSGTFPVTGITYQVYLMNGFMGYNGDAKINGTNGLRSGRQKGAESVFSSPDLALEIECFRFRGLQIGVSGYFGTTESVLYDDLDRADDALILQADSSVLNLNMFGLDARYEIGGLSARGQVNYGLLGNSSNYNLFTGSDAGSSIYGYYAEVAYNVLHHAENISYELIPFFRYESYDTQASVGATTVNDPSSRRDEITVGLGWKLDRGAMLKADYQRFVRGNSDPAGQFNMGVAVWF